MTQRPRSSDRSNTDLPAVTIGPFWLDPEPFPRDPNAPPSPSDRSPRPLPAAEETEPATLNADQLARQRAQSPLIGPSAGAELRRIVYGAPSRPQLGH